MPSTSPNCAAATVVLMMASPMSVQLHGDTRWTAPRCASSMALFVRQHERSSLQHMLLVVVGCF
jgi:hypothetical protein